MYDPLCDAATSYQRTTTSVIECMQQDQEVNVVTHPVQRLFAIIGLLAPFVSIAYLSAVHLVEMQVYVNTPLLHAGSTQ